MTPYIILSPEDKETTTKTTIDVYNYIYWGDYEQRLNELSQIALEEPWSFPGKGDHAILKNYLRHTFNRLQEEGKILETTNYRVFNTGLFNSCFHPIYVLAIKDEFKSHGWRFKSFCSDYELATCGIITPPPRAEYFSNPEALVFDWHYNVLPNFQHILEDEENRKRLPDIILNSDKPQHDLNDAINDSISRATANYKLAVPQYFNGQIQLLLPLYFGQDRKPSLALVLSKYKNDEGDYYLAHSCITMEMAYMNARVIAKPEPNWLLQNNNG